jgi:hypothetical protein
VHLLFDHVRQLLEDPAQLDNRGLDVLKQIEKMLFFSVAVNTNLTECQIQRIKAMLLNTF